MADTTQNDTIAVQTPHQFLPGAVPTDFDARNRFLNYQRDISIPKHRIRWNWVADLPIGKGKKIAGNAGGFADKLIGGWQIAGIGSLNSTYFSLPTGNWNFTGEPIHQYGYKYPIQDCRSGACIPGYLCWNDYIPSNQINSVDASGNPNGVMGVAAGYKPAVTPLIPWGSTALQANAPANTNVSTYWDSNNVCEMPLGDRPAAPGPSRSRSSVAVPVNCLRSLRLVCGGCGWGSDSGGVSSSVSGDNAPPELSLRSMMRRFSWRWRNFTFAAPLPGWETQDPGFVELFSCGGNLLGRPILAAGGFQPAHAPCTVERTQPRNRPSATLPAPRHPSALSAPSALSGFDASRSQTRQPHARRPRQDPGFRLGQTRCHGGRGRINPDPGSGNQDGSGGRHVRLQCLRNRCAASRSMHGRTNSVSASFSTKWCLAGAPSHGATSAGVMSAILREDPPDPPSRGNAVR